jgi:transcriptional regulator with XRE-family HTH domain
MTDSPGTRIKYLRQLTGLSQEELGKRVGVQRAAINKYEKGTVTNIPIQTIEKIAAVFDVSPTFIVGWNGDKENPLSAEVRVIKGIKHFYGSDAVDLIEIYSTIGDDGRKRIYQYAHDMSRLYANVEETCN